MNKLPLFAALLLVFSQAEAHSHPGIDSLTHSLEHLALTHQHWLPYLAAGMLSLGLSVGISKWRKSRRSAK